MLLPIARPKSTGTAFPMCRAVCLIVTSLFGAIEQRFETADAIAMKLGIEKTAMVRVPRCDCGRDRVGATYQLIANGTYRVRLVQPIIHRK